MCGRTTSYTSPRRIAEIFDAEPAAEVEDRDGPTWNIGPTCTLFGLAVPAAAAPAVAAAPERPLRLVLDGYRWGLIPPWAADVSQGSRLFNARSETVATKPAFRHALRSRRLAIVVDGFFEWRKAPGGHGQPFYFHRSDGLPMTFAGLWETWHDPVAGTPLRSCTIVTTVAGADMEGVHDRMPVILEQHQLGRWVGPSDTDPAVLTDCLRPAPPGTLVRHPVDPRVGDVRNDSPELLEPVEAEPVGQTALRLW